jgi:hypothetical protein
MKGMNAQRSNTATRLRRHCGMLFGASEADMLRPEVRKEKFRARIGWVDGGHGSGTYSSVDVEILHKDYLGSYDIKTAFLNPILMWVSYVATERSKKFMLLTNYCFCRSSLLLFGVQPQPSS